MERLKALKFEKVSELLSNSLSKIYRSDTEDGLTDLRASWEIFIKELVVRRGGKPEKNQAEIKKNLQNLKKMGLINEDCFNLISTLTYGLYGQYLGNSVHIRKRLGIREAKYIFSVFEESMNLLINKCLF